MIQGNGNINIFGKKKKIIRVYQIFKKCPIFGEAYAGG